MVFSFVSSYQHVIGMADLHKFIVRIGGGINIRMKFLDFLAIRQFDFGTAAAGRNVQYLIIAVQDKVLQRLGKG